MLKNAYSIIPPKEITKLITHSGVFHADDVFGTALMRLIGCEAPLYRVANKDDAVIQITDPLPTDLYYDVCGGAFDHHETAAEKETREDGTPYAAFGKLMRAYYPYLGLTREQYERLDDRFIKSMDAKDNGHGDERNDICEMIKSFNPSWEEDNDDALQMVRFEECVEMAKRILQRKVIRVISDFNAIPVAKMARKTLCDGVIYQDRFCPLGGTYLDDPMVRWTCYPGRGGISLFSLPSRTAKNKQLMPEQFRGISRSVFEVQKDGILFCHSTGFMATFISVEKVKEFAAKYLHDDRFDD